MKNIFEFIPYPHSRLSQEEKTKKPFRTATNIQFVLSLSKNENILLSSVVFGNHSFKNFHPSQTTIGRQIGIRRETACIKTTELHNRKLIVKKDNGFKLVNHQKRIYLKETCSYGIGPLLKQLNEDIKLYSEFPAEDYQKLIDSNPALYYVFWKNLTDIINLIKYKEVSITSKKNSFEEAPTNSQETSFFLKRGNCEISSPYMPTSIVSNECYEEYENPVFKKWVRHVQWKAREEKIARKRREVRRNRRDKIKTNSQTERGDKNYIFAKNAIIAKENGEDKGTSLRQGFKLTQRLKEILEYGK